MRSTQTAEKLQRQLTQSEWPHWLVGVGYNRKVITVIVNTQLEDNVFLPTEIDGFPVETRVVKSPTPYPER